MARPWNSCEHGRVGVTGLSAVRSRIPRASTRSALGTANSRRASFLMAAGDWQRTAAATTVNVEMNMKIGSRREKAEE